MSSKLIEAVVAAEEVKAGRVSGFSPVPRSVFAAQKKNTARRRSAPIRWTPQEDDFLRQNLGCMSEQEIAAKLGRTVVAVHLRWTRDLHLLAPSKNPRFITGEQAALVLDVEGHAVPHWCDMGLIPCRNMAASRKIRLIVRSVFERWVCNPENWIYFDWRKISDPRLKRLCAIRAKRWGDEWWDTPTVAKYHGVSSKDVQRLIYRGELPAVQTEVSKSGRHKNPTWLNWYVKKSDAVKAVFVKGRGAAAGWKPTPRASAWIKTAWRRGMTPEEICRSMGNPVSPCTLRRYMAVNLKLDLTNRRLNS